MTVDRAEIRALADELLADVELSRLSLEGLLSKAALLARYLNDKEACEWLWYEQFGYADSSEIALKYVTLTKRWIAREKGTAYWGSALQQEAAVEQYKTQMDVVKAFTPSGTCNFIQLQQQQTRINEIGGWITRHMCILASVRALIQNFALRTIVEIRFSETSSDIFETYQARVDAILASVAEDAFRKIPHIFERLEQGDAEAVSHAMITCRRVIDSVADRLFSGGAEIVEVNGESFDCKKGNTRNRLRAHVRRHTSSKSRYERLASTISKTYDRISTGVHADVEIDEARALVLTTYLMLGEIVQLDNIAGATL